MPRKRVVNSYIMDLVRKDWCTTPHCTNTPYYRNGVFKEIRFCKDCFNNPKLIKVVEELAQKELCKIALKQARLQRKAKSTL